jgi:hypothetical protein
LVPLFPVGWTFVLGVLFTLAGAMFPLVRARQIPPLDILRARVKVRAESGEWGTFALSELSRDGKPLAEANPSDETIDRDGDDDELGRFDEVAEEELPPELRPPKRGPLGPTRDDAPAAAPVQPAPRVRAARALRMDRSRRALPRVCASPCPPRTACPRDR